MAYLLWKRETISALWRSESPPTVFAWLMRHWFSRRIAFTCPNLGTARRMSKTFAVETYSGGSARILSIRTRPSLRSFFSFARLTLMSLARLRASILWSGDLSGALTGVFVGMARDSTVLGDGVQRVRPMRTKRSEE